MRPKKTRWIKCHPGERYFKPLGKLFNKDEGVCLTIDEFEAIRLADFEKLQQIEASLRMHISRPTFSRILSSAHHKIAQGLVSIKTIKIEGGCCKIGKVKKT